MRYKLIALDVDGTILDGNHMIAPETKQAIHQAQTLGVRVTIASGRAFPSAAMIAEEAGITGTPLVAHDGGYVADRHTGEVLFVERLPDDLVSEVAGLLQGLGCDVSLLHESFRVGTQRFPLWQWRFLHPRHWSTVGNLWRELQSYRNIYAPSIPAYLRTNKVNPPKLYIMGTPAAIQQGSALLTEHFSHVLRTTPAGLGAMEVTPLHVSKASGIRVLAEKLGIHMDEVIGVGDNYNDVEMIQQAGLGVAMGNAPADIQALARYVTRTNREHGVAHVIEKFVLDQGQTAAV